METVNIHDAGMSLEQLVAAVERGDEVVITRNGIAVAKLVPAGPTIPCEPGAWRHLPGWENFEYDPSIFAPMTDQEMADEGWP